MNLGCTLSPQHPFPKRLWAVREEADCAVHEVVIAGPQGRFEGERQEVVFPEGFKACHPKVLDNPWQKCRMVG